MSKPFKLTAPRALEHQEQAALFRYAAIQARNDPRWALLFAIPNGTSASSMAEAVKAKKTGRQRGVPDMFLPVPVTRETGRDPSGFVCCEQFPGMFIEMKRQGGRSSDLSPEQRVWLASLDYQGYKTVVAYGWQAAADAIAEYLGEASNNE